MAVQIDGAVQAARPKILIVDDRPRNLDVLEAMLDDTGCELVRATSADEALLYLVRHEFAALVLDIKMPGMGGIELATLVKQRKRTQHVPILFLTAHLVDEEDVLRGYGAGAVDYLTKPVNTAILRSKVSVFVDLFRKTRALADVNEALQREIAERESAQHALQRANEELERRVYERTFALTKAHQGVRENEERLRMALDVAHIAAWEWNLSTGRKQWSTDPETLFRFPRGAFGPELRITRVVHTDDRERLESAIDAALNTGIYDADFRAVRPDGSVVYVTERGRLFSDLDGERIIGITRDVTAERESAQERDRLLKSERTARNEAERQGRLRDEFLATLSHELRTPMNIILGWLETLLRGEEVRATKAVLEIVRRNSQLQAKLIDELLDMNRLISGNVRIEPSPIDAVAALQAAVQGLQPAALARGVRLSVSAHVSNITIVADASRLQQVLWNLLQNAIKFTSAGGVVDARVTSGDGHVIIAISDNGRGISPEFLPHVFERFRQEDSSTTRESMGLGLGLSITKHLVELHGATIEAASDGPGKGSRFVIKWPNMPETGEPRATSMKAIED